MRISWDNIIMKPGVTVLATNENSNFPVTNLYSNALELPFKALGNSSTVTINLDTDYEINHIAYGFHNLTSFTVNFYDSLDALITSQVVPININRMNKVDFLYFDVSGVRKIELVLVTTDINIYLGGFSTGLYFQFPDHVNGISVPHKIRGSNFINKSGQVFGSPSRNNREYSFKFRFVEEEAYQEITNIIKSVSSYRAHFVDLFEAAPNIVTLVPFWGIISSNTDDGGKESQNDFSVLFSITYTEVY